MTSSTGTKERGASDNAAASVTCKAWPLASTAINRGRVSGTLHAREVLLAGVWVFDGHGQVERQPRDVRERVSGVNRKGREHREDVGAVELAQALLLGLAKLVVAHNANSLGGESRPHLAHEHLCVLVHEHVCAVGESLYEPRGANAGSRRHGEPGRNTSPKAGYAHHEKLVEVRREDRQVSRALQKGHRGVFGKL